MSSFEKTIKIKQTNCQRIISILDRKVAFEAIQIMLKRIDKLLQSKVNLSHQINVIYLNLFINMANDKNISCFFIKVLKGVYQKLI